MVANYSFYDGKGQTGIRQHDEPIRKIAEAMARDPQLVKAARNYVEAAKFYLVPIQVRVSYPSMGPLCIADGVASAYGTICEASGLMPAYWRTNSPIPNALLEARTRIMNGSSRPTMPYGLRFKELRVLEEDLALSLRPYNINMPITSIEQRLRELNNELQKSGATNSGYMSSYGQLGIAEIESALSVYYVHLIAKAAADPKNSQFKKQIDWYLNDKRATKQAILNGFDPDVESKLGQGGNAIAVDIRGYVSDAEQMGYIKPTETPLTKTAFQYALELSECYRSNAPVCPIPRRPQSYEDNYRIQYR